MFSQDTFSAPTLFKVINTDLIKPHDVTLFLSGQNRDKPNYGLPSPVNVVFSYNTSTYNYGQLLSMSEDQPFMLWKFRYDVLRGDAVAQTAEIMNVAMSNSEGTITEMPLAPYEDLDQTQAQSREFRYPFSIDADRGLSFKIGAGVIMQFYIWYDMIASQTNLLMSGTPLADMTKPFPLEAKDPYLVRIVWGEQPPRIIDGNEK